MKRSFSIIGFWLFLLVFRSAIGQAQDLIGDWQTTLVAGQNKLRAVVKVKSGPDGKLAASFYSIDQTPDPLPIDSISLDGRTVRFKMETVHGSYEGMLSADSNTIDGTWTQGGTTSMKFERATKATAWVIDPSKHTVQMVAVEPDVKLEVLDWGGKGRPVVLLTGLGDTAHIFDSFADKLTSKYHVYAITRRGFGSSDVPPVAGEAYSANRLGDDVKAILDKLKIEEPVLVGHSIAGEELSSIGSRFAKRVAGLVYLDAGYSYALYDATRGDLQIDTNTLREKMTALSDAQSPSDIQALIAEMQKIDLPRYEKDLSTKQKVAEETPEVPIRPAPDRRDRQWLPRDGVIAGEQKFIDIRSPVLAIFADPHSMGNARQMDEKQKAAAVRDAESTEAQAKAWERLIPTATVIRIPNASHYIFKSNETQVLDLIEGWINRLPQK